MNPDPHSSHMSYELEKRVKQLESSVELLIAEAKALRRKLFADKQPTQPCPSPRDYWLLRENELKPWIVLDYEPYTGLIHTCFPGGWELKRVREICPPT